MRIWKVNHRIMGRTDIYIVIAESEDSAINLIVSKTIGTPKHASKGEWTYEPLGHPFKFEERIIHIDKG